MATIARRRLGRGGPMVSAIGLGCMGMSEFYGAGDKRESIATIHRALDLGVDFLDTADMYGPYTNGTPARRRPARAGRPRAHRRRDARRARRRASAIEAMMRVVGR
jgi:aryl-alcohol dehydrogenase-like predicted oxidoreductase